MNTQRMERLRSLSSEKAKVAERELVVARASFVSAEDALREATEALKLANGQWLDPTSSAEMQNAADRRAALAIRVDRSRDRTALAAAEIEAKRVALVTRRQEERRFELLLENEQTALRARGARIDRRAADEHSARGWRDAR